ncbi:MAG: CHAT domain-containing tetratricopeptide repeat protein [Candidatus Rhabdochlamydia sp.]
MNIATNVLTRAGLIKMPLSGSSSVGKIRIYSFLNQEPDDIAKLQAIFDLEFKEKSYQININKAFDEVQAKPYLLREGSAFRLISREEAFAWQNQYKKSREASVQFYKIALKIVLKLKGLDDEGKIYSKLGATYHGIGDYPNAVKCHEEDLKIALKLKDFANEQRAYCNLGNTYRKLRDYTRAITYYEKYLKIALELKDLVSEEIAYYNLGNAYEEAGDYTRAIIYNEQSLKIALELKDLASEGGAYSSLGRAYRKLGHYSESITYHKKHLKVAFELKDLVIEGSAYCNLGNAYIDFGDYREAITCYKKYLKIALELKNVVSKGSAYGNLGNVYQLLGDYRNAITYHENALKIALKLKDSPGEGDAYNNLGNDHHLLGDYGEAITYHENALKIALKLKDSPGEGDAYNNLGNAYRKLGDYGEAITYYKKALKIALELKNLIAKGRAYGSLGIAHQSLGDYNSAITFYEERLRIALELKDLVSEGRAYCNLGYAYFYLENSNKAEEYFQKSVKISALLHHQVREAQWQISFFEGQSLIYTGLEFALLQQNKLYKALEVTDMRRARALSSLISRNPSLSFSQNTPLESLEIQQIRDLAKKFNTTFIMYSLLPIRYTNRFLQAWIISSKNEAISSISLPIPDDASVNPEQIFKSFPYQAETKCPKRGEKSPSTLFKEKLSSWYNCLIAPLEPYLPAKDSGETLTFIPDGFLAHLPFGAFYNERQDQYLIENYPVSIAPSIGVLSLLDQLPKNDSNEVLLMGNPAILETKLDALEFAEKEVSRVLAPMLGLSQDEIFIQEKATPMCVLAKAPQAKLVHIACHGVAHQKPLEKPDPHSVFEGLFKLSPDDNHPLGHLHAADIASMSLKADLVFMSACHLGRGNLKREGSIGPIWSFLGSGAKSTVASYWPLPDGKITVKMVEEFYKHYLGIETPKVSKAKALQQAALLAMKTERDQPRQWGAFFLSGLIE